MGEFVLEKYIRSYKVGLNHSESPPQLENQIMARVYVRSITRSTMYQKAPFCDERELAYGKIVL